MKKKRKNNSGKLIAIIIVIALIIGGLTALLSDKSEDIQTEDTTLDAPVVENEIADDVDIPSEETAEETEPEEYELVPLREVESDRKKDKKTEETPKETPAETPTEAPVEVPTETPESSTFSILFIDVGQGDSALVECDGHYMLIDGGNKADSDLIYTILKDKKIEHLDILVGTHADEDHVGGLAGALNYAKADLTLCPVLTYDSKAFENFAKYADKNGNGITIPNVGDTYSLGSAQIIVAAVNTDTNSNDTSIVLKIVYKETSFLFTGDAEILTEETLSKSAFDLSATVLKVGHHGSATSSSEEFLKAVAPEYAVISVGEDNDYGHPTQTVLDRLGSLGVKVYRTDLQGDILCVSDGKTVTFEVEKNETADTLTAPSVKAENETAQQPEAEIPPTTEQTSGQYDYILNTNTGKFHWPGCSSVDNMNEENKCYYSGTRQSVIDMGYSPCGNCHP